MKEFEAELHRYYAVFQLSLNYLLLLYFDFLFRVDLLTSFIYLRYFLGTRVRTGASQVAKIMKSTKKVLIQHLIAIFTLFQISLILFNSI